MKKKDQRKKAMTRTAHGKTMKQEGKNIFERLMEATKVCSLGQITSALFEVGGQYRRNM